MRALLVAVNAKYIHSNLAVYSIRAYGLAHGIPKENLLLAEYTINQNQDEILADIFYRQPDFLAFSCYIWNIQQIKELTVELHKILPHVPIWVGGPEVSYCSEDLLGECPWLSGVMVGEGEATFLELYQSYAGTQNAASNGFFVGADGGSPSTAGKCVKPKSVSINIDAQISSPSGTAGGWVQPDLSGVAGLVYRDWGAKQVMKTPERENLSMDALVFPYGDMDGLANRIVYYETSRGCPFGCSYCLSAVDRKVRLRSMSLVEKELQFFLDRKVPQVKFVDRTFNCQKEHTMAVWRYIYEHDNGITNFHFELSADLLTEEEIDFVRKFRPGLVQFEIGVQSVNKDTLRAIHRTNSLDLLKQKVTQVKRAGNIHQHLDLIAGLPWEDYDSFRQSFNEVYGMKPDQLQLGFLKLLRGSPIFRQQQEFGIACQDKAPYEVLFTRWLPYRDVLRLKQVEDMVERYYNSMQFEASLAYVLGQFPTAFDFYQELGAFYQDKGYVGFHQSRMQNYEILLEFCQEKTFCDGDIIRQLMLYDLYAREKLKSRPQFLEAEITSEQKEKNRLFYQNEALRQQYLPGYAAYDWKQTARMTHLQHFGFHVPCFLRDGQIRWEACALLFDYQQRNPLNHQARISVISPEHLL